MVDASMEGVLVRMLTAIPKGAERLTEDVARIIAAFYRATFLSGQARLTYRKRRREPYLGYVRVGDAKYPLGFKLQRANLPRGMPEDLLYGPGY